MTYWEMYNRIIDDLIREYQENRPFCSHDEAEAEVLKDGPAISRLAWALTEGRTK